MIEDFPLEGTEASDIKAALLAVNKETLALFDTLDANPALTVAVVDDLTRLQDEWNTLVDTLRQPRLRLEQDRIDRIFRTGSHGR
jgi:hypothetical protein